VVLHPEGLFHNPTFLLSFLGHIGNYVTLSIFLGNFDFQFKSYRL